MVGDIYCGKRTLIDEIILYLIMSILKISLSLMVAIESDAEKLLAITYYLIFSKSKFLHNKIRWEMVRKPNPK